MEFKYLKDRNNILSQEKEISEASFNKHYITKLFFEDRVVNTLLEAKKQNILDFEIIVQKEEEKQIGINLVNEELPEYIVDKYIYMLYVKTLDFYTSGIENTEITLEHSPTQISVTTKLDALAYSKPLKNLNNFLDDLFQKLDERLER